MRVHLSTDAALRFRFEDLKNIFSNKWSGHAVWGPSCAMLGIITQGGIQPVISSNLIVQSDIQEMLTGKYGKRMGRVYLINKNCNILEEIKNASADELDLFMYLANPSLINNPKVQKAITDRIDAICLEAFDCAKIEPSHQGYAEQMKKWHQERTAFCESLFTYYEHAKEGAGRSYMVEFDGTSTETIR